MTGVIHRTIRRANATSEKPAATCYFRLPARSNGLCVSHGIQEIPRVRWRGHLPCQELLVGHVLAVKSFRSVVVLLDHRAIKRDAGEGAFATRVSQNWRFQLPICSCCSVASHWTGRSRCITAELELV